MNRAQAGLILMGMGLLAFVVRYLGAAWVASHAGTIDPAALFGAIQDHAGGGLTALGVVFVVLGFILLVLGMRSGRTA
jgi:hypothetical protein